MAPTFSLVDEVNATKKNWAFRVLVVRAYETSSRDNPDEKSTLEFVFQDMKLGNFWVLATVVAVETDKDWYYLSCKEKNCAKKVNPVGKRFRLQLRVVDGTGNAAFLVWNHEAVDLLGKTVAELKAELREVFAHVV
ncbi:uncharacterized protein Fot_43003 [Forsythia ovata]|uniref:Replication factor A C-terminal domain-containing protein n=1 Tax=Forsythia ovata TaxID=205694 RepID=A0ABD1RMT2_9LAMI